MVHLGSMGTFWKLAQVTAISALLSGTAFAQRAVDQPSVSSQAASELPTIPVIPQDPIAKRARENAYRSALQKIPDKNTKTDPWANIRENPAASSAAK
jgi:hypothetical protein